MHVGGRSKARITLILVLAKWQLEGCVILLITKSEGAFIQKCPHPLRSELRERFLSSL